MYTTSKNLDVLLKPSMEELCQMELRNKKIKKKIDNNNFYSVRSVQYGLSKIRN